MRRTWTLMIVTVAALGGWFGQRAFSEDGGEEPVGGPDMEAAMLAMATPGEMHAWLARAAGEWVVTSEGMQPDGTVVTTTGSATIRMILGGRFQEQEFEGTFEDKPFQGRGLTGYDNLSKTFNNYWFDTLGTAASVASGTLSEDQRTLTLAGSWAMPDGTAMPFQFVTTYESATCMVFTIRGEMKGQSMTLMTARYTRK